MLQHLYPQRLLCALMYRATRIRFRPWKNWQIRWFVRRYGVDMSEALLPHPAQYPDFNTFFTRPLRPGARRFDAAGESVASPADGRLGQLGRIREDSLIQAKGIRYSLRRLLGGSEVRSARFEGGSFLTIYLAPGNYHRVHMPLSGTLCETVHVPGRLFSVGTGNTRRIPNLFARNERVASLFEGELGSFAVIMVGALFVGGIEQAWCGPITPPRGRGTEVRDYRSHASPPALGKCDEMGRFNMGSTVIALFGPELGVEWESDLAPGRAIRVGERVARLAAVSHPRFANREETAANPAR